MAEKPPKQRGRGRGGYEGGRGRGGRPRSSSKERYEHGSAGGLPPQNAYHTSSHQNLSSDRGGTRSQGNNRGHPRGGRMSRGSSISDLSNNGNQCNKNQSKSWYKPNEPSDQSKNQHGVRNDGRPGIFNFPPPFMQPSFYRESGMPPPRGPGPMRGGSGPMRGGQGPMRGGSGQMRGGPGPMRGGPGPMRGGPGPMRGGPGSMRGGQGPMRGDSGPMRGGPGPMRGGPGPIRVGPGPMRGGPGRMGGGTGPMRGAFPFPLEHSFINQAGFADYVPPHQGHSQGMPNARRNSTGGRPTGGNDIGRDASRGSPTCRSSYNEMRHRDQTKTENNTSHSNRGGCRGRGRRRGGRWAQYTKRYNTAEQDDDDTSQCDSVSVRSSSPVSIMSDMPDMGDVDGKVKKDRVNADDIQSVSDKLLRNRINRYRKRILQLKKELPINQEEIDNYNFVISKIKIELENRQKSEEKMPDSKTESHVIYDEPKTESKNYFPERRDIRKSFRSRGKSRGGCWAQYSRRYNQAIQDYDDDTSQCDSVSVRSSSPVSIMSDMPDMGDVDGKIKTKYHISIDDIKDVSVQTLINRVKRYQMKISSFKSEKHVDQEKIQHYNYAISEIRDELKSRREKSKKRENLKKEQEVKIEDNNSDVSESEGTSDPELVSSTKIHHRKVAGKVSAKKGGISFRPGAIKKVSAKTLKRDINREVITERVQLDAIQKSVANTVKSGLDKVESTKEKSIVNDNIDSKKTNKKENLETLKQTKEKKKAASKQKVENEYTGIGEDEIKKMENLLSGLDFPFCQEKPVSTFEEIGMRWDLNAGASVESDPEGTAKASDENKRKKKDRSKRKSGKSDRERKVSETGVEGPDVNDVFKFIVKQMAGQGTLELVASISSLFLEYPDIILIKKWFQKHSNRFTLLYRGEELTSIYVFVLKKELKYCFDYTTAHSCQRADSCPFMHLCRDYLRGYCQYGEQKCRFSHNLKDDHNRKLVLEMGYNTVFSSDEICSILRVRYPHICIPWNKGTCNDGNCAKLHMCQRYVLDECLDGKDCLFVHDRFTEHNKPIVEAYRMGLWNENLFKKMIIIDKSSPLHVLPEGSAAPTSSLQKHAPEKPATPTKPTSLSRANRVLVTPAENKTYVTTTPLIPHQTRVDTAGVLVTPAENKTCVTTTPLIPHQTRVDTAGVLTTPAENKTYVTTTPLILISHQMRVDTVRVTEMAQPQIKVLTQQRTPLHQPKANVSIVKEPVSEVKTSVPTQHRASLEQSDQRAAADVASSTLDEEIQDDLTDYDYICDLDLVDQCNHGDCERYHMRSQKRPYIWQVKVFGCWFNLEEGEKEVEQLFCSHQLNTEEIFLQNVGCAVMFLFNGNEISAQFCDQLDFDNIEARRISTASFVDTADGNESFKTQWRWYWEDDYRSWSLFEDTMQFTLESKFLAGQKEYLFSRENYKHKNRIDFSEMTQLNLDTYRKRKILRRPLMVTARDVRHRRFPKMLRPPPAIDVPLPVGWVPWDQTNKFELVKLDADSAEYMKVSRNFYKTLSQRKQPIDCIYRVQSHPLWRAFCGTEKLMKTSLALSDPHAVLDRRELFHGTDNFDTVRGICSQNFDQRVSGKNATMYGDGAYFARDAKYSHCYTKPPERFMFLAHVLVGKFTEGQKSYRRPPELPGSRHELYDSCVDKLRDPSIFIVFDKSQLYPAYLIQYKDVDDDDDHYNGATGFVPLSQVYNTPSTTYVTANPSSSNPKASKVTTPSKQAKKDSSCSIQ